MAAKQALDPVRKPKTFKGAQNAPDAPGVYLMKDKVGRILYVGKAVSLKKRLASYGSRPQPPKTAALLSTIARVEVRRTASEHEAFLLESDLIKRHQPRFNVLLKDDKSYPVIKITREDFPRVFIGRSRGLKDDADVFGPYTDAALLRRGLNILRKSFLFVTCRRFPKKACLNYHLKLCAAPCERRISEKKYRKMIEALEDFLTQKDADLITKLAGRMQTLSRQKHFEEAAAARDQLEALGLLMSSKKATPWGGLSTAGGESPRGDFRRLGLKREPRRVETFDVSNIGASWAVGSLVSFWKGQPDKNQYRRFRIKKVRGQDDYAMMREIVRRRYLRLIKEGARRPDLVVIDGGRGHLEAACGVLRELQWEIPIIAIAKSQDLIYTIDHKEGVKLERMSPLLRLIQRGRNEAHRFAVSYHRLLRRKGMYERKEADGV